MPWLKLRNRAFFCFKSLSRFIKVSKYGIEIKQAILSSQSRLYLGELCVKFKSWLLKLTHSKWPKTDLRVLCSKLLTINDLAIFSLLCLVNYILIFLAHDSSWNSASIIRPVLLCIIKSISLADLVDLPSDISSTDSRKLLLPWAFWPTNKLILGFKSNWTSV